MNKARSPRARTESWVLAVVLVFASVLGAWSQAAVDQEIGAGGVPRTMTSEPGRGVWVFAYFRQRYDARVEVDAQGHTHTVPLPNPMRDERLHLALSEDGRHWTPLNGNRPGWNQRLRDPFVRRGPDGRWRLVATGAAPGSRRDRQTGPVCLTATSRDLVSWEGVRSLALMRGVEDKGGRPARNIWAPVWVLAARTGDFVLIWS